MSGNELNVSRSALLLITELAMFNFLTSFYFILLLDYTLSYRINRPHLKTAFNDLKQKHTLFMSPNTAQLFPELHALLRPSSIRSVSLITFTITSIV